MKKLFSLLLLVGLVGCSKQPPSDDTVKTVAAVCVKNNQSVKVVIGLSSTVECVPK